MAYWEVILINNIQLALVLGFNSLKVYWDKNDDSNSAFFPIINEKILSKTKDIEMDDTSCERNCEQHLL